MAPVKDETTPKEEKRGAHLKVPDHLKKPKNVYVPTGNPRGRKPGQKNGMKDGRRNNGAHLKKKVVEVAE